MGIIALTALFMSSCESAPEEIPPDLSRMEMFQRAQEASDQGRYERALAYYDEFISRYPDDQGALMEAKYEIAFIAYKRDKLVEARRGFQELLQTYESDDADDLPAWPRVLAEKLIERIDEQREQDGLLDEDAANDSQTDTE